MTLIQPNKNNNYINRFLILFVVCFFIQAIWLVILYNQLVNLDYNAAKVKTEFQKIQARNAELKNKSFTLLDSINVHDFARERNLIQEKRPLYITVHQQWLASQ